MNSLLPWYVSGPLIGLIVPLLLILREKQFGISSSYQYLGSKFFKKIDFFNKIGEKDKWQFHFAIGLVLSGLFNCFFGNEPEIKLSSDSPHYAEIAATIYSSKNIFYFFIGGIFVGFGSRYANGCTAGHCIMGVSQFSKSSIVATVCFFIGGLIVSYGVIPFIF